MNKSESIGTLAAALSKAQGKYKPVVRNCTNPFFKSHYADLAAIFDATREALMTNELSVIQTNEISDNGKLVVVTTLMHSSGEWISGTLSMKPVKEDPQGQGSCLTYIRRYAMQQILGVASEDEDDGNIASQGGKEIDKKPINAATGDVISEPQRKRLFAISKKAGISEEDIKAFLLTYGFTSSKLITKDKYEEICTKVEAGNIKSNNPEGCTKDPVRCEHSVYNDNKEAVCFVDDNNPCKYYRKELL